MGKKALWRKAGKKASLTTKHPLTPPSRSARSAAKQPARLLPRIDRGVSQHADFDGPDIKISEYCAIWPRSSRAWVRFNKRHGAGVSCAVRP